MLDHLSQVEKNIIRALPSGFIQTTDAVAVEEPLEIRLMHPSWKEAYSLVITMRTPGHDEELVTGYLFTEDIIAGPAHITNMVFPDPQIIEVHLAREVVFDPAQVRRQAISNSGCGVCGKTSLLFLAANSRYQPYASRPVISLETIQSLPTALETGQKQFKASGGVHAAALFNLAGELLWLREDIGRHNAVDKLIGTGLRENLALPWEQYICLVSGRAGFELIQKISMTGVSIFLAVGAPSSLAIDWAERNQLTLVGFLKGDRFNVYTCPERINMI